MMSLINQINLPVVEELQTLLDCQRFGIVRLVLAGALIVTWTKLECLKDQQV